MAKFFLHNYPPIIFPKALSWTTGKISFLSYFLFLQYTILVTSSIISTVIIFTTVLSPSFISFEFTDFNVLFVFLVKFCNYTNLSAITTPSISSTTSVSLVWSGVGRETGVFCFDCVLFVLNCSCNFLFQDKTYAGATERYISVMCLWFQVLMIVITNSIVCLSLWCSLVNVSEKSFIFPLYNINFLVNDILLRNGSSVVL